MNQVASPPGPHRVIDPFVFLLPAFLFVYHGLRPLSVRGRVQSRRGRGEEEPPAAVASSEDMGELPYPVCPLRNVVGEGSDIQLWAELPVIAHVRGKAER